MFFHVNYTGVQKLNNGHNMFILLLAKKHEVLQIGTIPTVQLLDVTPLSRHKGSQVS